LANGVKADPVVAKQVVVPVDEPGSARVVGELHVGAVAGAAAEAQEVGFLEIVCREEYPRSDGGPQAHVAGEVANAARDDEMGGADVQRIADPGIELDEDRRVDQRLPGATKSLPQSLWVGHNRAVVRIVTA